MEILKNSRKRNSIISPYIHQTILYILPFFLIYSPPLFVLFCFFLFYGSILKQLSDFISLISALVYDSNINIYIWV